MKTLNKIKSLTFVEIVMIGLGALIALMVVMFAINLITHGIHDYTRFA